ncbi:Protein ssh4 [Fusarium solani]|uniref:Protein SSH4 n=1 Tax=Fusarium solani TaxID=169388 RepID=A0A9P9GWF5_FUSSL|nr:concanavalin A-like lectin/glucanase domain-containing protein [Fusarium solani]KAH7246859.1 concanavalin A-like lectin/glucanase domain-containing protein [Fusarium solani]KAJ4216731.1 Protein ssh4 [Fusarium solani]
MGLSSSPSSAFTGVVIGLVSSFGSIVLIALVIFIFWVSGCASTGRIILDRLGRPGEYDDEQAFARDEAEALEVMDDMARQEYLRAKAWVTANTPESAQTDISLSQYLAIQEKGVSAWEFEPELEIANCFVEARTEIEFFDSECTVMSNLPVPKQNDVYYWEAKIYEKPETTLLSIGMATKPYPLFRLPGYHKYSVGYQSTGTRRYNQPFGATPYGPQLVQGDVVGVGYRPRTGAIFFTRNGKKLEEVVHGLKSQNFFPAIGANGPAMIHVNFGQAGFVFIEANVKKWGLAPATGSLAPPPPYGSEQGSILLETGTDSGTTYPQGRQHSHSVTACSYNTRPPTSNLNPQHGRTRSGNFRVLPPTSPGPGRSSTDISLAHFVPNEENGEGSNAGPQHETHDHNPLHLHLEDATNPPPEYQSPDHSGSEDGRRYSTDSENTPLIRVMNRSRGNSAATVIPPRQHANDRNPPVPSYSDAVRQGAGRDRSDSARLPQRDRPSSNRPRSSTSA